MDTELVVDNKSEFIEEGDKYNFNPPKYMSTFLNYAAHWSHATRSSQVGCTTEIFKEFKEEHPEGDITDWEDFYMDSEYGGESIEGATTKTWEMFQKFQESIMEVNREMCREYIESVIFHSTYKGHMTERIVMNKVAEELDKSVTLPSSEEDRVGGIDGFIGGTPVQVKPISYSDRIIQSEYTNISLIYYKEKDKKLYIDTSEFMNSSNIESPVVTVS